MFLCATNDEQDWSYVSLPSNPMACSHLSQVEEKAILTQQYVKGGMHCMAGKNARTQAVSSNSPLAIAKAGQNEMEN